MISTAGGLQAKYRYGNAKIWLAARSQSKTQAVIDEIKAAHSGSSGDMIFLKCELDDLATIIATVQESLSRENRLDVLWNNAGSETVQGYELQLRINNIARHLLTNKYSRSKAENFRQAAEYARRVMTSGIISLSLNPGNFVNNLQQNMSKVQLAAFTLISHPPKNGAYTQLFAGLDQSITMEYSGGWDLLDPELGGQY
ncbi:hypothetical protein BDP55DRAFT_699537 [Colletotrichum godetiae]|uniref:Short-chain dehydrogenase n=1 Tax=Colletotrichum godetiae TaxID=1209918 RepID=A0AAJ0B1H7_9PEZI|nr:uncharacterized protein BDP55DRAFT_699537 [Colletotrichum godetiae]KAK1700896.1 hypothetical protein BDP55DRAFT_699537 [Colletotrichum godetiae]